MDTSIRGRLGITLHLPPECLTSVSGKANNECAVSFIGNERLIHSSFLFWLLQMASTQDARYSQKDSSDQNFDYMFKLLIIGNSSVGKTSFLFRYADDSFTSAFVSTVGIDFKVKTVFKNEKRIKLQIWVSHFELTVFFSRQYRTRKCIGENLAALFQPLVPQALILKFSPTQPSVSKAVGWCLLKVWTMNYILQRTYAP